jgi:hypothetical protein
MKVSKRILVNGGGTCLRGSLNVLGVAADETGLLLVVVVGVVGHFGCREGVSDVSGASACFLVDISS